MTFDESGERIVTFLGNRLGVWPVSGAEPTFIATEVVPLGLDAKRIVRLPQDCTLVGFDTAPLVVLSGDGGILWRSSEPFQMVAADPDRSTVVAGYEKELVFFAADSGAELRRIKRRRRDQVRALALTGDGWLAVGTEASVEFYAPG